MGASSQAYLVCARPRLSEVISGHEFFEDIQELGEMGFDLIIVAQVIRPWDDSVLITISCYRKAVKPVMNIHFPAE